MVMVLAMINGLIFSQPISGKFTGVIIANGLVYEKLRVDKHQPFGLIQTLNI